MYSHVLHSVIGVDVVQISFHFHPENLSNSVTKKYFLIKFSDHFNDFFSFFFLDEQPWNFCIQKRQ